MTMLRRSKLCYLLTGLTSLNTTTERWFFNMRPFLHFSTLQIQNPSRKPHLMIDYLINSCGFSLDQANRVSNHLTHLNSPSKPGSVLNFLKQSGFSDAHIREIVSEYPKLLCSNVEKTLKPKFSAFQEVGFSHSGIIQLVADNPKILRFTDLREKLGILRSLLITNETILIASRKLDSFLSASLAKRIMPNVSFLRQCGVPDHQIGQMIVNSTWFLCFSTSSMMAAVKKADELGVSRSSRMFGRVLQCIVRTRRATLDAKFRLFETLGWSKAEVMASLRKNPAVFMLSQKSIRDKMDFLVNEVGCEVSYVVNRPLLFGFSLERRLVPRHKVLKILKKEELLREEQDFLSAMIYCEKDFMKKFVLPHKEKVPGIHEAYVAASSSKVPM